MERALAVWLVAVVVLGAAWLYGVFRAGHDLRPVVAWGGGAAALALCVTLAVAAYYAALARRAQEAVRAETGGAASLERQITEVADSTLPALLHRIAAGAPPEAALGEILPPPDPGLRRVLQLTALDAAARRRDAANAQTVLDGLEAEVDRIIDEAMPVIVARIRRDRVGPETVLPEVGEPESPMLRRLLARVVDDLATGERGSAAAMMSCANAAARIQAACTRLLGDLRDLEHRYGDDPVFHDLLDIDHEVSQAGRIADSIALLAGGRSGRRWTKPIVMESILRGAMGRIHDYRRVKLHFTTGSAIAGYAAEGVMHCLAELMDNAASFSAHNTDVHVYVEEEDAGIVVTIEDSGLGMRQRERARAERLVNEPSDLTALPGTRLGLAVVGRLAAKHGLRISFRPSSRGGTAAIVLIPRQLVTQPRQDLLPPELREPWDGSTRPPLAGTGLPGPDASAVPPGRLLFDASPDGASPAAPAPSATSSSARSSWTDDAPLPPAIVPPATPVERDTAPDDASALTLGTPDQGEHRTDGAGADGAGTDGNDDGTDGDDDGFELPQRRRGATLAASPDPVPVPAARTEEDRPAPGARFAAFRSATGGPRTVTRDTGGDPAPAGTRTPTAEPTTGPTSGPTAGTPETTVTVELGGGPPAGSEAPSASGNGAPATPPDGATPDRDGERS
ncbi:sensor histidine kinase [Actinomadura gamaensis]|uniref:histidine kinase n=1 Tax=Actinomadura gamaensis TaxID=1763541 RepID=A0ABV9U834_9ACTN